ncbi:MAG TPA: hypothetical protein VGM93_09365, partial [Acidimicrobiales bacterium]
NDYLINSSYQRADAMRFIGQYDPSSLDHNADWYPGGLKGVHDGGAWALTGDDSNCLWFGGDFKRQSYSGTSADWIENFGRFCPTDATPPSTPANVTGKVAGDNIKLTWDAATDDSGGPVRYWVYRNDRVIGTTTGTTFSDPGASGTTQYVVRAVDPTGNQSATLVPIALTAPPRVSDILVAKGSRWQYKDDGTDPGAEWASAGFDSSTWATGSGVLGWGKAQATTIGATRPVTTYFRSTFTVGDPSRVHALLLSALVDDGAVAYVNGHEVARVNMGPEAPNPSTLASAFTTGNQEVTYRPFVIPATVLQAGTNTIAIEVHQASVRNADGLFDLQLATTDG